MGSGRRLRVCFPFATLLVVDAGCFLYPPLDGLSADADADAGSGPDDGAGPLDTTPSDAPADAQSGPLLVQQRAAIVQNNAQVVVTLPNTPANGHALILAAAGNADAPTAVNGGGVTWLQQARSGQHVPSAIWAGIGVASGGAAITVSFVGPQATAAAIVSEWAGVESIGQNAAAGGTTSDVSTPSLELPNRQLVFAMLGSHNWPTSGPANGFTALQGISANDFLLLASYAIGTGTLETGWTQTSQNNGAWDTIIASFGP